MKEKHTCSGSVWDNHWSYPCGKSANYEHDGKFYCKTHHPPTVKAKREAQNVKWEAESREQRERRASAQSVQSELERRSRAYDAVMAWAKLGPGSSFGLKMKDGVTQGIYDILGMLENTK